jgi:electron transfer flavoprotein alpha subunit
VGSGASRLIQTLEGSPVEEALLLEDQALGSSSVEVQARALAHMIHERRPRLVLWTATPTGSDFASRVAAILDEGIVSDCVTIELDEKGAVLCGKPTYGGQVHATLRFRENAATGLATVRPGAGARWIPVNRRSPSLSNVSVHLDHDASAVLLKEVVRPDSLAIDLEEADVIVAGGRGVGSVENFRLLEELASVLGGTVGASRIAIDNRWVARDKQIGQSGKVVRPKVYIACGISGSSHHVLGMKDSQTIVAINTDPNAPILSLADVGIVGDLREVVPALTRELQVSKEDGGPR